MGFTASGASFATLSGAEYDLQDLVPQGPDGEDAGNYMFYISQMDNGGATSTTYLYRTVDGDGAPKNGWYNLDDEDEYMEGVTFKPGQAVFVNTDFGSGASIRSAGQVELGEISTPTPMGFCGICNPRPVTIDLQDVIPEGPDGEDAGNYMFYISLMDNGGATSTTYLYRSVDGDGAPKNGWYNLDDEDEYIEGVTFEPGEGFFVNTDFSEGAQVTFKAVTL